MNNVDVSPSNGFSQVYDSMNNSLSSINPLVLLALTIIIIFYFIIFSYLGSGEGAVPTPMPKSQGLVVIEVIMWGLFIFLILINGLQYFFKIDVKTAVKNLFSGKPQVDINIKPEERLLVKKGKSLIGGIGGELEADLGLGNFGGRSQVFNIPGNEYTFEESKALCKAYGAKLATYSQIESAYKSGAEWCNYGWSDKQLALYPTQKTTWHKLQKIKGHEHDCGRPGINGGFIDNPNVRFGANCYGSKPNITEEEQKIMNNATPYPKTAEDRKIDKLVKHYKKKLSSILVSPFNYKSWARF